MFRFLIRAAAISVLLATPAFAQDQRPIAILKICKVGIGIAPGTPFTFNVNSNSFNGSVTVASGGPPSGNCWIAGGFPAPANVTVTEVVPGGDVVTNITLQGSGALNANPPNPTATITGIGAGVSVLTYTNERKRLGYLEICKYTQSPGNYTFHFNPSSIPPVTVPAMGCSPPFQAPSGTVDITEVAPPGTWVTCLAFQGGLSQVPTCNPPTPANTATVTVVAGGVQAETLVIVFNKPHHPGEPTDSRSNNDESGRMMKSLGLPAQ